MRLAILGATGRTGVRLVEQALARGHQLTVLARSADKARATLPDRLTLVEGDLLDAVAVEKALQGADAVVNVAGPAKGSPTDLQRQAIGIVLQAMRSHGVPRLVTLTGAGVGVQGDEPKAIDRLFRFALARLKPDLLTDSEEYVDRVRRSDRSWTVVRAPRLTDGAPTGAPRAALHVGSGTGTKLDRADLATFILDELEANRFVRRHPVVWS